MTRHLAVGTHFVAGLALAASMTTVLAGQATAPAAVALAVGEEKEICSGARAAVTPSPPKFGELRTAGDPKGDDPVHIFYKAKDTAAAVSESLTCTSGADKKTVNLDVTPKRSSTSGFSDETYPEAFKALFLLFVLATLLESALAILFNWRPFVETFNARAVRPVVSLAFSFALVYMFDIDLVTALAKLIRPEVQPLDGTGHLLTAMVIAGGSAGVNNLMVGLGFRQVRTPETAVPKPPLDTGWISVSIVRTDKIKGPVTVAIGVADAATKQIPVVASLEQSTRPAYRYFFRDRGRFPGSGGYAVKKGDLVAVTVSALKNDVSKTTIDKTWGPKVIAEGAIIDLTFTMAE